MFYCKQLQTVVDFKFARRLKLLQMYLTDGLEFMESIEDIKEWCSIK